MHTNPLDRYLRETQESERDLAKRAKVHYSRISRYRSGESIPLPDVAEAIEAATSKRVPASYWMDRLRARSRKARKARRAVRP